MKFIIEFNKKPGYKREGEEHAKMYAFVCRDAQEIFADAGILKVIKTQEQQHCIIQQQYAKC